MVLLSILVKQTKPYKCISRLLKFYDANEMALLKIVEIKKESTTQKNSQ